MYIEQVLNKPCLTATDPHCILNICLMGIAAHQFYSFWKMLLIHLPLGLFAYWGLYNPWHHLYMQHQPSQPLVTASVTIHQMKPGGCLPILMPILVLLWSPKLAVIHLPQPLPVDITAGADDLAQVTVEEVTFSNFSTEDAACLFSEGAAFHTSSATMCISNILLTIHAVPGDTFLAGYC